MIDKEETLTLTKANQLEHFVKYLRASGTRVTAPRRLILEVLIDSAKPMSPREVHALLADRAAACDEVCADPTSVYRSLELFEKIGLVHRALPDGRYVICAGHDHKDENHVLTHCRNCHSSAELHLSPKSRLEIEHALGKECDLRKSTLHIEGICRSCQGKLKCTD